MYIYPQLCNLYRQNWLPKPIYRSNYGVQRQLCFSRKKHSDLRPSMPSIVYGVLLVVSDLNAASINRKCFSRGLFRKISAALTYRSWSQMFMGFHTFRNDELSSFLGKSLNGWERGQRRRMQRDRYGWSSVCFALSGVPLFKSVLLPEINETLNLYNSVHRAERGRTVRFEWEFRANKLRSQVVVYPPYIGDTVSNIDSLKTSTDRSAV